VYNGTDEWKIKKAIVANNIYGVDLNPESVEISKLSLWLKTANRKETLADLSGNIKQGNSLIDDPKVAGDDAFDWNHAFAEIMQAGGFDVVVGNPPWGAEISKKQRENLFHRYAIPGEAETFAYFIIKADEILCKNGITSFITPNTWLYLDKYELVRESLLKRSLNTIVELEKRIFEEVPDIVPVIHIVRKTEAQIDNFVTTHKLAKGIVPSNLIETSQFRTLKVKGSNWKKIEAKPFLIGLSDDVKSIIDKLGNKEPKVSNNYIVRYGIKTGNNEKYLTLNPKNGNNRDWKKCLASASSIKRYGLEWEGDYLSWGEHLSGYTKNSLETPKVVIQYIRKISMDRRLICTLDSNGEYYPLNNFSFIQSREMDYSLEFLLGILNSTLINFYFKNIFVDYNIKPKYIEKLPLVNPEKKLDNLVKTMLTLHKSISEQSQHFIDLLRGNFVFDTTSKLKKWHTLEFIDVIAELEKGGAKLPPKKQGEWLELFKTEKEKIKTTQDEIDKTDKEIDQLVYALYELTPEEIAIVEKG
jgi:hypothetical protein